MTIKSFLILYASSSLLAFAELAFSFVSPERRCSLVVSRTPTRMRDVSLSAIREATFGMGCFWEPAESLLKRPGVLATTAGYTGAPANKPPPTYDAVCFGNDWVEAVRVVYDDEVISYDKLLDDFFQYQKPQYSRQYASIIFTNGEAEEKEANEWKERNLSAQVDTGNNLSYNIVEIESASKFYKAEEYHQRYWEKFRIRADIAVLLIAAESGVFDKIRIGEVLIGDIEFFNFSFGSICGGLFLVGAGWMLLERLIARDVIELKPGDFTKMALQE